MLMGGIDKLDLKIPKGTERSSWLACLYRDVLRFTNGKPSKSYARVYDLRPYGLEALLHDRCRYDQHSKVELLSVQCMCAQEIRAQIEQMYVCEPDLLRVMRVDLFGDAFDLPVWWFRRNAWVKYKRTVAEFGPQAPCADITCKWKVESGIETLYFGQRPTLFRIYDKGSTLRAAYLKQQELAPPGIDIPSFSETYGHPAERVRTRVEHQLAGGNVPDQLCTLGLLFSNAPMYDPFSRLVLSPISDVWPTPKDGDAAGYLQSVGLSYLVREHGRVATTMTLNRLSRGNAARFMRRLDQFIDLWSNLEVPDLLGAYRQGLMVQIGPELASLATTDIELITNTTENSLCNLY